MSVNAWMRRGAGSTFIDDSCKTKKLGAMCSAICAKFCVRCISLIAVHFCVHYAMTDFTPRTSAWEILWAWGSWWPSASWACCCRHRTWKLVTLFTQLTLFVPFTIENYCSNRWQRVHVLYGPQIMRWLRRPRNVKNKRSSNDIYWHIAFLYQSAMLSPSYKHIWMNSTCMPFF